MGRYALCMRFVWNSNMRQGVYIYLVCFYSVRFLGPDPCCAENCNALFVRAIDFKISTILLRQKSYISCNIKTYVIFVPRQKWHTIENSYYQLTVCSSRVPELVCATTRYVWNILLTTMIYCEHILFAIFYDKAYYFFKKYPLGLPFYCTNCMLP
jgi:hypothetical protein